MWTEAPPNSPAARHWTDTGRGSEGVLLTTILGQALPPPNEQSLGGFLALHSIMLQRPSASQSLTAANSTWQNSTYSQWLTNSVTHTDKAGFWLSWWWWGQQNRPRVRLKVFNDDSMFRKKKKSQWSPPGKHGSSLTYCCIPIALKAILHLWDRFYILNVAKLGMSKVHLPGQIQPANWF